MLADDRKTRNVREPTRRLEDVTNRLQLTAAPYLTALPQTLVPWQGRDNCVYIAIKLTNVPCDTTTVHITMQFSRPLKCG